MHYRPHTTALIRYGVTLPVLILLFSCSSTQPLSPQSTASTQSTIAGNPSVGSSFPSKNAQKAGKRGVHQSSQSSGVGRNQLTLDRIMSDPDWVGRQPLSMRWDATLTKVLYERKREGEQINDWYLLKPGEHSASKFDSQSQEPQKSELQHNNGQVLDAKTFRSAYYDELIYHAELNLHGWINQGDLFAKVNGKITRLTNDSNLAQDLQPFSGNTELGLAAGFTYRVGDRFYAIEATTGRRVELFSLSFTQPSSNGDGSSSSDTDFIAKEQRQLINYVALQEHNAKLKKQQRNQLQQFTRPTGKRVVLDPSHERVFVSINPQATHALVAIRKASNGGSSDVMPNYIGQDGRIEIRSVRQRVADAKPEQHKLYLLDLRADAESTATAISYKGLPGFNDDVLAAVKRENAAAQGRSYRRNRLPRPIGLLFNFYATDPPIQWHKDGTTAAIMLEAWDNKDRWLTTLSINSTQPVLEVQHRLSDPAWINYRFNYFGWLHERNSLFFLSEHSGYSHLYEKPINGSLRTLTSGQFIVDHPRVNGAQDAIYYQANKEHPGIYEVYRLQLDDGQSQQLTDLNGVTEFRLHPFTDDLILSHSTLLRPPELWFLQNGQLTQLTHTVSEEFATRSWIEPDIMTIPSSHQSKPIYARLYLPNDWSADRRYPAIVFNHGAGYLQNAHYGWSSYFREFMFHSFLVEQGYIVLDMDYRASAGYGRDWRTAIYRNMGKPELEDNRDGIEYLVKHYNVDSDRIGTYGGSYGGFLTFMALFTEPDLYAAGAALRPVTDWAHYNTPYTANILNTPSVDPMAYRRSSPIYHADGLQVPMLISAPMVDDNVFFLDVVRLVQRLIELEKEHFETAIYPVEPHGFVQPSSWLDQYRRIFRLFEQEVK